MSNKGSLFSKFFLTVLTVKWLKQKRNNNKNYSLNFDRLISYFLIGVDSLMCFQLIFIISSMVTQVALVDFRTFDL